MYLKIYLVLLKIPFKVMILFRDGVIIIIYQKLWEIIKLLQQLLQMVSQILLNLIILFSHIKWNLILNNFYNIKKKETVFNIFKIRIIVWSMNFRYWNMSIQDKPSNLLDKMFFKNNQMLQIFGWEDHNLYLHFIKILIKTFTFV